MPGRHVPKVSKWAIASQGHTQPDTSQIFGKRTVSKTIFGSSSLFCMDCGIFDKPPCDLLHGQSSRHLKEPFASLSSENGMHEEWITQGHSTPHLLG